jgi:hypothetical protein
MKLTVTHVPLLHSALSLLTVGHHPHVYLSGSGLLQASQVAKEPHGFGAGCPVTIVIDVMGMLVVAFRPLLMSTDE